MAEQQSPFSSWRIPGLKRDAQYCLYRVDRSFDGMYEPIKRLEMYECPDNDGRMQTSRLRAEMSWRITVPLACDEAAERWPASQLQASGTVVRRADGYGLFSGRCRIFAQPPGQPATTYFRGRLELLARNGSQQMLAEPCAVQNHIEGWLVGLGVGSLRNHSLRASLVIAGELPATTTAFPQANINRLTGVLVRRT